MSSPKLIASATPTSLFLNSQLEKQMLPAALTIEDEDIEIFEKSVDAVSGEGTAVADTGAAPTNQ